MPPDRFTDDGAAGALSCRQPFARDLADGPLGPAGGWVGVIQRSEHSSCRHLAGRRHTLGSQRARWEHPRRRGDHRRPRAASRI